MDEGDCKRLGEVVLGEDLYNLSVEQLKVRLELLELEKQRIQTAFAQKQADLSVAHKLFDN